VRRLKAFIILLAECCARKAPCECPLWTNMDATSPVAMDLRLFSGGKHVA